MVTEQSVKPATRYARVYFWTDINILAVFWYPYATANRGNRKFHKELPKKKFFDCGSAARATVVREESIFIQLMIK